MKFRKFASLMFSAALLVFVLGCGKGHEAATKEDQGVDDQAPQTNTAAGTQTQTGAPATAAAAPVVADAATITGVVKFAGTAPKPSTIPMGADPYCSSQHPNGQGAQDEEVVVSPAGELANVLVYIKNPPPGNYPTPSAPAVLDQKGCRYYPHVQALQVNQALQIKNDDQALHNVHAMPVVNSQFNEGQPIQGMVSTKKFDKVEMTPFKVKCDVHGWMKSWMAVMPHPFYAVSQMNGTFTIPNLPPGTYTLVSWHEKYGPQEQQITVGPKESKQVSITYKG
jgi:Carboxypeptidase regulatory-like domain